MRCRRLRRLVLTSAFVTLFSTVTYGQGRSTAPLSGVVMDPAGGVLPGATVVVKNNGTNVTSEAVTNQAGAFSVPALDPGVYTVSVSLEGFKTAVINDVRMQVAVPSDLKVTLEIGRVEETVMVTGNTELVQSSSASVAATMTVDQIQNLPLPTRNAVNFAAFLPGVNTVGVNRDSNFNGLPDSAVAIVLDGVNNNENYNKSTEGLFAMVTPRQDAVEAVTVTTATAGSESGGHGAISIQFVTRSGSDRFSGSLYEYYRDASLNTNYYFNTIRGLPKNQISMNQYGGRVGGPILIPGLYNGRGKAFFFFNVEDLKQPNEYSRRRNVLNPASQNGIFRYNATEGGQQIVREVNLYALAASRGMTSTPDPTVASVLGAIRSATGTTGTLSQSPEPNIMYYDFLSPGDQTERQPTTRLDYNLSPNHRLTGTYIWQKVVRDPDQLNGTDIRFPGLPNFRKYVSYRKLASGTFRSVLKPSLVNELRGGIKYGPSFFGRAAWNGPETFSNSAGHALTFPSIGLTPTNIHVTGSNTPSERSAWSWNIDETVNWQVGNHGFSFGGSFFDGHVWVTNQTMVPAMTFGVDSSDPASAMFTQANFAGASSAQLTQARNLYAMLTGRVLSITADARLDEDSNQYVLLGPRTQRLRQKETGIFWQDSWRVDPKLTLNLGVRWDLQLPIEPTNNIMSTASYADLCGVSGVGSDGRCNLFQPGTLAGRPPMFVQYDKGNPGYHTDWNNVAPSLGVAWRPGVRGGFLRTILGDPEQATIRGGYSIGYNREGMALFTGQIGANPGSTISVVRNVTLGNLVPAGQSWPLLLREESRLAIPAFASSPQYPIAATVADSINIFHPDIRVSYAPSFSVGLQRAISRNMAMEVRYVGTRGRGIWTEENYNELNIVENGFLEEFKRAQANLQANLAAGRGATFAYTGVPGTSPLPIYLAYFNGVPTTQSGDASKYTGTNWTSSTFYARLAVRNPQPQTSANDLHGNANRRDSAAKAGLPVNFFVVNPNVNQSNVYTSHGSSKYDALQLELRRRMFQGLQVSANYQYARSYGSRYLGLRYGRVLQENIDPTDSDDPFDPGYRSVPRHSFKTTWNFDLPFGRGRRFGGNMGRLADTIAGGWEFHGAGRVQNRQLNFGNVRLVGMTARELRDMYKIRYATDPATGVKTVWILPEDVILNTSRAFSVDATSPTGYSALGVPEGKYLAPANGPDCIQLKPGDCAPLEQTVMSPLFTRFDFSFVKKFRITGTTNFELRLDVMNVFNNVNFIPVAETGTGATINQVIEGYTDTSNTFDPGGRLGQLVFRFSW